MHVIRLGPFGDISAAYGVVEVFSLDLGRGSRVVFGLFGGFACGACFGCLLLVLAFPCFRIGLFALPLCGAAL
jgi:hypothetical protein